jgi:3-hydroxyacyl-CoA dehydrogenase
MTGTVHQEVRDGILILTIDNPPVNASSRQVREGVVAGVERLVEDASLTAAVLVGAAGKFIAGSDISEFEGTVPDPLLPAVIATIEQSPKPVVAALSGVALGGGLELALGCDVRIGTADVALGLPEITLGFVPGAGGTQRLPRLVGRAAAAEFILTGRRITGADAVAIGLLDAVVADVELIDAAVERARAATKRVTGRLPVPAGDDVDESLGGPVERRRPNIGVAIELIRMAGERDIAESLRIERAAFDELRLSDDARALRHLFFAERSAPRRAGLKPDTSSVSTVGVIGAGAMGAGIAAAFAVAGARVVVVDASESQLAPAQQRVRTALEKASRRGRIRSEELDERARALTVSTDLAALAECDLVIEAVVERLEVKTEVLRRVETVAPSATLATNTSYLGVSDIAQTLADPGRLVGMHFFNPADVMKLVEIIPGAQTSDAAMHVSLSAARLLGKVAVIAGDREGFIGNRIFSVYRRHAEYLLEDGATPSEVDAAMEQFGFAMGPFAVADLSGLQIAQSLRTRWRENGRLPERYVEIPDVLCDRGWLGRRSGRGYYRYVEGERQDDLEVVELIVAESARKEIVRAALSDDEIVTRLLGAMVVEGARIVEEGVARHIDDIDVALVNGFGFPRFRGGPMWWAAAQSSAFRAELAAAVADASRESSAAALLEGVFGRG